MHVAVHRDEAVDRVLQENRLAKEVEALDYKLSNNSLALLPEYGHKLKMLKEANFVSSEEVSRSPTPVFVSFQAPGRPCSTV